MRSRQDLIELFSAFVLLEANRFHGWAMDAKLRRNMQRCLNKVSTQETSTSEFWWIHYWHHCWIQADGNAPSSLPLGHLSAYLQEPCYWVAHQAIGKFTSTQYGLSDYFQIAIAEVPTVLNRFQPDRGANLKTFANIAFSSLLKDHLRQRQEINFCTTMGLLRRVSKKRLLEALRQAGLATATMAQYRLAWMCFNALYVQPQTGTQQLPPFDRPLWMAIADLYNAERRNQLDPSVPDCTPEMMERWLNQCATWVRSYLYPAIESLNVPKAGTESGNEIQDTLSDPLQDSLLSELVVQEELQERQQQQSQLRDEIVRALATLEPQSQELLRLYYQQGLTQQQMMQALNLSQATVSRRLTKARETILIALVQWRQQTLNSSPDPNLIKDMSAALEEWLGVHYDVLKPFCSSETTGQERRL
jgi:RNA polymerase sigma factor (sigma-70 family)